MHFLASQREAFVGIGLISPSHRLQTYGEGTGQEFGQLTVLCSCLPLQIGLRPVVETRRSGKLLHGHQLDSCL